MESIEEIQARHRRELRDLQGRITNKKKNATKKTRKGVNDECAALEQATRERHQAELQAASGGANNDEKEDGDNVSDTDDQPSRDGENGDAQKDGADAVAAKLADASIGDGNAAQPPQQQQQQPKKRNRQKERLARRAAEQEEQAAKAADEASQMVDYAALERNAMKTLITKAGRVEHPINSDGHCLFSAVADQLAGVNRSVQLEPSDAGLPAFRAVRYAAARYMEANPDNFAPFLLASEDGTDLETYIKEIRDTAKWGGQLELTALANAYDVYIRVLHDGRSELIEPAESKDEGRDPRPTLWVVYYRHHLGLGEHYNSLRVQPAA
ncbi:OTU protein [Sporothrix eucalyptigena]|uniref:OTU protein n=1 Tax=Sporothrix eucalyptigena TaxID=1812306 RepID=A0ABP0BM42_9PEZI